MKCAKHNERDAVSQCVDCGKALCPECTHKFSIPLCDQCSLNRITADKKLLIKNTVLMIVLFVLGFVWQNEGGFMGKVFTGYLFAGIPWGWSLLNMITPTIFLFMPIVGWLIYFLVKFVVAIMIGIFVTPYKIYKVIKGLNEAKTLEIYTKDISQ